MPTTRRTFAAHDASPTDDAQAGPRSGFPGRVFWFVVLGVVVLTASVIGTGWLLNLHATGSRPPGSGSPTSADITTVVGIGHVDVETKITSLHPLQQGRVKEVLVKEGAPVKKGDVIFRLESRKAQYDVAQAEAALKISQAALAKALEGPKLLDQQVAEFNKEIEAAEHGKAAAEALYKKAKNQFENKVISLEEMTVVQERFREAEKKVEALKEKLNGVKMRATQVKQVVEEARGDVTLKEILRDEAQYALDECSLKAPCDGKILRLNVAVGDVLGPQSREPAVQFCPNVARIIRAEIEQEFASRVQVGQRALIQDDATMTGDWHGQVRSISDWYTHRRSMVFEPRQFNDVRTIEVIVELDPKQKELKIGQRVRVTLGK